MIKLKSLLLEGKYKYFYHATEPDFLPSIVHNGLIPGEETHWGGDLGKWSEDKIFVTDKFYWANYYGNVGVWKGLSSERYKPILRFKYDSSRLIKDPQTLIGDYYSEIPIKTQFEIFMDLDNTVPDHQGKIYYNRKKGHWRILTKEIADAIATGEWDNEIINDEDDMI